MRGDSKGWLSLFRVPHFGGREYSFSGVERRFLPKYYLDPDDAANRATAGFGPRPFARGRGPDRNHFDANTPRWP